MCKSNVVWLRTGPQDKLLSKCGMGPRRADGWLQRQLSRGGEVWVSHLVLSSSDVDESYREAGLVKGAGQKL